jgi:hypothetical protein
VIPILSNPYLSSLWEVPEEAPFAVEPPSLFSALVHAVSCTRLPSMNTITPTPIYPSSPTLFRPIGPLSITPTATFQTASTTRPLRHSVLFHPPTPTKIVKLLLPFPPSPFPALSWSLAMRKAVSHLLLGLIFGAQLLSVSHLAQSAYLCSASTRSWTPLKVVGDGSFGTVWLCDWHGTLPPNTPLSPMQCGAGARAEWSGKTLVAVKRMKKRWEGGWDECRRLKELEVRPSSFLPSFF